MNLEYKSRNLAAEPLIAFEVKGYSCRSGIIRVDDKKTALPLIKIGSQFILLMGACLLAACESAPKPAEMTTKPLRIGSYEFAFPHDFKLLTASGIDSYVGRIKGDSMEFRFDYGHYSNELILTPDEFLAKQEWRLEASFQFMKEGVSYDDETMPKVVVISTRPAHKADSTLGAGCSYVSKMQYGKKYFDYPVYLPEEIKQHNVFIDSVEGHFRRLVVAKKPESGITGVYLVKRGESAEGTDNALVLGVSGISKAQQVLAIQILKSGKPVKPSHQHPNSTTSSVSK